MIGNSDSDDSKMIAPLRATHRGVGRVGYRIVTREALDALYGALRSF